MRHHRTTLKTGIQPTPEFAKKGLAEFAVNIGTKCSHDCLYCSTGALLRMHPSFQQAGESPFRFGYAITDSSTPERVAADARNLRRRGLVQLCTTVDAWAPEAQVHQLGRRCLEAILSQPGWSVRILTKNAAVRHDFDLVERYRDRVLVGLSLTATPAKERQIQVVEKNASSIPERLDALHEAHRRGLRTYGMLCPLMPGIADDRASVSELVQACQNFGAEEVFVETVNARGPGLKLTEEALQKAGFPKEASAINRIRSAQNWSPYCRNLIATVQTVMRQKRMIGKLRFLLYPGRLTNADLQSIRADSEGVVWL